MLIKLYKLCRPTRIQLAQHGCSKIVMLCQSMLPHLGRPDAAQMLITLYKLCRPTRIQLARHGCLKTITLCQSMPPYLGRAEAA